MISRILREKRRIALPLGAAVAVNILLYAFGVYPLGLKVAADDARYRTSREALRGAEAEHERVRLTLERRDQARQDLDAFYTEVLPADLERASRAEMALFKEARDLGLKPGRVEFERTWLENSDLARKSASLPIEGDYRNIRALIHKVETSQEFIVIDSVGLANADERGGPLRLSLTVSTYFRAGGKPLPRDTRSR